MRLTTAALAIAQSVAQVVCTSAVARAQISGGEEVRQEVIRTWQEERQRREEGESIGVVDVEQRGSEVVVRVTATKDDACYVSTAQLTEVREVRVRQPDWALVGGGGCIGLAGVGLIAGGLASLAFAPGQPPLDDPYSRGELSSEGATAVGVLLAVTGGLALLAGGGGAGLSILIAGEEPGPTRVLETAGEPEMTYCPEPRPAANETVTVRLARSRWTSSEYTGTTDDDGEGQVIVPTQALSVPEAGEPWALVRVGEGPETEFTPPADFFQNAVTASDDIGQYERFQKRFPGAPEWAWLAPRFKQLDEERKARAAADDEARRKAQADAWEARAREAIRKAKQLSRRAEWDDAYDTLVGVGSAPDELAESKLAKQVDSELALAKTKARNIGADSAIPPCPAVFSVLGIQKGERAAFVDAAFANRSGLVTTNRVTGVPMMVWYFELRSGSVRLLPVRGDISSGQFGAACSLPVGRTIDSWEALGVRWANLTCDVEAGDEDYGLGLALRNGVVVGVRDETTGDFRECRP